jgi:predicted SnoaL-like aldol condensation-catalyzing enzyme
MTYSQQEEANRRLVSAVYEHVLKPLDSSRVDEFFAPDYIQHNPMAATGASGLKTFLNWARSTSPGATHEVKRMFADGDHVIAHVHVVINPGDRGNAVIDISGSRTAALRSTGTQRSRFLRRQRIKTGCSERLERTTPKAGVHRQPTRRR